MFYFTCSPEHKLFLFFTGVNNEDTNIVGMDFRIVGRGSRNICCKGRCCLINNSLRAGIPIGINCVPLLVYFFPCRFRYVDDDFVFKKTCYSNQLLLIYTQVYLKLSILLIQNDSSSIYKW
jgi:hypothetical protein